ncbi:hypothetical protein LCGC14_0960640 [marine sediment metagenome]|uniref:AAA domain-containing protein n=1 Tax=marine sediment metagenome TaxID=412755 RepID=A0A0F9QXR4_9ZZZZ
MALTKRTIPKPPKSAASARPPKAPKARAATTVPAKNFKITAGERPTDGKKILIHADSGMGKTTLASLAPGPVFIGLDNGGVGIKVYNRVGDNDNPVETYLDVRAALQANIYDEYESVVLDTVTILEEWAEQHVLDTITNDNGEKMSSIVKYGWSNGYKHLYDMMKLILQDCDALIRKGKNVILIAQSTPHNVPNPGGEDFIRQGPRLVSRKNANVEALYCEWADHIFHIGYQFLNVDKKKKATGSGGRAIFVHPEPHFRAKSRTLGLDKAVVSFEDPTDDSIWTFLFAD